MVVPLTWGTARPVIWKMLVGHLRANNLDQRPTRVVARDTSNNDSAPSLAAAFANASDPYVGFGQRYASCPTATVTVSTAFVPVRPSGATTNGVW